MSQSRLALAMSVGFADPEIVELIGLAGYDAVFVDLEHSAFELRVVQEMICRAESAKISTIVRVPENNPKTILRLLDIGADGILIPHIGGVDDAREAIRAVRYPPRGIRGAHSTSRAARYGLVSWREHVESSNREILLGVTIEDHEVAPQAAEIAALEGLDLVFVGPSDLATSMGVLEDNDLRVREVVLEIARTVERVGNARFGFVLNHKTVTMDAPELTRVGASFALCLPGPPVQLLGAMSAQVRDVRERLGYATKDGAEVPLRAE